jgi:hypothetical protein
MDSTSDCFALKHKTDAPIGLYFEFARMDDPKNLSTPIVFLQVELGISVFFNPDEDDSYVTVEFQKTQKDEKLRGILFAGFAGYVEGNSSQSFVREYGERDYLTKSTGQTLRVRILEEKRGDGTSKCSFGIQVPYRGKSADDMPRLHFAKLVMEIIQKSYIQTLDLTNPE